MQVNRKIVITGGPGTGKTVIIDHLKSHGHYCLDEISREVILAARAEGVEQLFLTEPILFSQRLLDGRIAQYQEVESVPKTIFFDRGIPDTVAYMDYFNTAYPEHFKNACRNHPYDMVFLLPPWEEIYCCDNERYESFEQATAIYNALKATYLNYGYTPIEVPLDTVENRVNYIESQLK
ncbi:AAA family ATPase [Galbibacter sp.]|jgi:predicted ATPase|uniref:AAA family ATPase n=1 Tax=Galbibacter sp. TaxID=2918471 RepID=UPI003A956723